MQGWRESKREREALASEKLGARGPTRDQIRVNNINSIVAVADQCEHYYPLLAAQLTDFKRQSILISLTPSPCPRAAFAPAFASTAFCLHQAPSPAPVISVALRPSTTPPSPYTRASSTTTPAQSQPPRRNDVQHDRRRHGHRHDASEQDAARSVGQGAGKA